MNVSLKDLFAPVLAIFSICISLYQLWESRRKKIKIYLGTNIIVKDEILSHFLTFSIVNRSNHPIYIFDTRFYLYEKKHSGLAKRLRKKTTGTQVYFNAEGHVYDESLERDKVYKISIEAYDIFSHYSFKGRQVKALAIELIDMDGNKYKKKIRLNQLEHDENRKFRTTAYCYPIRFHKHEEKMRKIKKKELKKKNQTLKSDV